MQGLQAALGLGDEDTWQAATGFGGGFGRQQLICGALSGGVIACGMALARKRQATRETRAALRDETYATVKELTRRFQERFGAIDCRTLTGYDFSQPNGYQAFADSGNKDRVCHPAVRFVVETVVDLTSE